MLTIQQDPNEFPLSLGKYIYIEASTPNQGDSAWLISEDIRPTLGGCIQFWAHMYGSDIGKLNVFIRDQNSTMRRIWTLEGQQGTTSNWFNGHAPLASLSDFQVNSPPPSVFLVLVF